LPNNLAVGRLLWRDAQGVEGSVDLDGREILIGRALECAIRTEDAMVSRHHARVFPISGQYYVEDMGSSNGIYYQEQRVQRHPMRHGDAIRCGSLWLRYVESSRGGGGGGGGSRATGAEPAQPIPRRRREQATSAPPVDFNSVPPAFQSHVSDAGGTGGADAEEVPRMRRRIEQLQAELRLWRGGGEDAARFNQVEEELARLAEERDRYKMRVAELEAQLRAEGGDAKVQRAGAIAQTANEIVSGLNDVLSNLRINVMAAEGEFDQYSNVNTGE
jgi:hypothetical protein